MGGEVNAMLMDWEDLTRKECALSGISAIYQTPAYRKLRNDSRKINGFLLIEKGECHYLWQDGSAWLFPGSVIYLPKGSRHTMTVTTSEIAFTRVDFTVTVGGQEAFRIRCGGIVPAEGEDRRVRVYSHSGEFLMVGRAENGLLKTEKSFFEVS